MAGLGSDAHANKLEPFQPGSPVAGLFSAARVACYACMHCRIIDSGKYTHTYIYIRCVANTEPLDIVGRDGGSKVKLSGPLCLVTYHVFASSPPSPQNATEIAQIQERAPHRVSRRVAHPRRAHRSRSPCSAARALIRELSSAVHYSLNDGALH